MNTRHDIFTLGVVVNKNSSLSNKIVYVDHLLNYLCNYKHNCHDPIIILM